MLALMTRRGCSSGALFLLLGSLLGGCSSIGTLDGSAASPAPSEQEAIRQQVQQAVGEGRYKTAWNQEIAAGGIRADLEGIALAALKGNSGHSGDMFAALRSKWGALGADSRKQVTALTEAAETAGNWVRALHIELQTADDPPAFTRAWAVYAAAPVGRAPALLEVLQEAQADAAESAAADGGGKERDD